MKMCNKARLPCSACPRWFLLLIVGIAAFGSLSRCLAASPAQTVGEPAGEWVRVNNGEPKKLGNFGDEYVDPAAHKKLAVSQIAQILLLLLLIIVLAISIRRG